MSDPRLRLSPEAGRLVSKFPPETKRLIRVALDELRKDPQRGHDLQEELSGFKSYKQGRYRIVYIINDQQRSIDIYYIGHRRDVYDQLRRLLLEAGK